MPVAKELTELVEIDPQRVDRVKSPANGFPVLIMKSAVKDVNAQGGVDETPEIRGAEDVLICLAKLIAAEAREMATGRWNEIWDIQLLTEAACLMRQFKACEMEGALENDGEPLLKDLGPLSKEELTQAATWVMKRKVSSEERKKLASEGNALPDGSYPIENEEDLHNAAILARSGHGDVAAAKKLIAKRAKELGVANPLAGSASKETMEDNHPIPVTDPTPTEVNPVIPEPKTEKSVEDLVAEAIAKEVKPLTETIKGLNDELAALKAKPIPGGPVITAAKATAAVDNSNPAEAERYERLAKSTSDRELARYYAERAKEAREASGK